MTNLIHSHCIQYDLYITSSIHLSHNITEFTGTCIPNGNKQYGILSKVVSWILGYR